MIRFNKFRTCFPLMFLLFLFLLTCVGCSNSVPTLDTSLTEVAPTIPLDYVEPTLTPTSSPTPTIEPFDKTTPESEPLKTYQLTLLAVGDNLVHSQVIDSGKKEDGQYNYDHLFSQLKKEIKSADISIINQETILGGVDFDYTGYPVFNSPTEIGDAINNAGFDVVLHATNHAMDKGYKGIQNTLEYWEGHPHISVLGLNKSANAQEEITVIQKNGITVAMLNYTYGLNGYSLPSDMPYLVNMLDKPRIAKDIAKAKDLADFIIVFPHWGTEYEYEPDSNQEDWTNFFAEQGVDLVIGTHPHVLETVEWVMTESGHKMLVYYSLGNYVSYQKEAPRMLGGIASITLTKKNTKVYISEAGITPIVTHYENHDDYCYGIYKLTDYTEDQAQVHGILELEENSLFTLEGTWELARQVLGDWIE